MNECQGDPEFIHDPKAARVRAYGLHDMELLGEDCSFTLWHYIRTPGGVLIRTPSVYLDMPLAAVGPAIALVLRKAAGRLIIPAAVTEAVLEMTRGLMH